MNLADRLQTVTRLFLDTAPVIYYVEAHPKYLPVIEVVFDRLDRDELVAVTSPVTLAECLVFPYRLKQAELIQTFSDLLVAGANITFVEINHAIARRAAELRAEHNLSLADALQVAAALEAGCDAFLTNDANLKRITEIGIVVLGEMETV